MEFDSPSHILPPDGARLCYDNEVAEPGDWVLSQGGRIWDKLLATRPDFSRAVTGHIYATTRPHRPAKGSRKLTAEMVKEIRRRWKNRDTMKSLGAEFGCSWRHIQDILQGKKWKGVK